MTRRIAFLLLAGFLFATMAAAQSGIDLARAHRQEHEAAILHDFAALLTYPNRA